MENRLDYSITDLAIFDEMMNKYGWATYFLSGSHQSDERPETTHFYEHEDRALTKKGSLIVFDAHFTKPFMKQQMDYTIFLGYNFGESLTEDLRGILSAGS